MDAFLIASFWLDVTESPLKCDLFRTRRSSGEQIMGKTIGAIRRRDWNN